MASLIKGYNYDIFISYRQKDNKGDKWVSEFVDALKDELESTFKEEISVYFDINPHDGLLETHDVDESLKEKLKCLVFIPIISRTYCDPKSFAWEHEFIVFVDQASQDQFGLKIKLPGGNVANRVLPVRIYDLDKEDIKLCESVLGGVLRGVEFIHKASGVNRPLTPKDDLIIESGKVFYRDQVNKVANAIKDVLNSLTTKELSGNEAIAEEVEVAGYKNISTKRSIRKKVTDITYDSFLYKLRNLTTLSRKTRLIVALFLFFFLMSFGAYWFGKETPHSIARPISAYEIEMSPTSSNTSNKTRHKVAVSPDGLFIAYTINNELYLKALNSNEPPVKIPGIKDPQNPFFSPDGKWIGFELVGSMIMKVQREGGKPVKICDTKAWCYGFDWRGSDIIFSNSKTIFRVDDSGGVPEIIYELSKSEINTYIFSPQLLPGNRTLLFSKREKDGSWNIMSLRMGGKSSPEILVEGGRNIRYLNSGHIVYYSDNRLYIREFNNITNRFSSEKRIIPTEMVAETNSGFKFDFSQNGILAYLEEPGVKNQLVWMEASGSVTLNITREPKKYNLSSLSSDGQYIAVEVDISNDGTGNSFQIEIIDTKSGTGRLFEKPGRSPVWSKNDSSIFYVSAGNIFHKPINLSSSPKVLFKFPDSTSFVQLGGLSQDGKYLPFYALRTGWNRDIGYYDMLNNSVIMLDHYNTESSEIHPNISPDGKWIAYSSDYDGQFAIYVAPFPGPGESKRVSLNKEMGMIKYPAWAQDMNALYYVTDLPDYALWEARIHTSEIITFEEPRTIFNGRENFYGSDLNIHPDGNRFLGYQIVEDAKRGVYLQVVVNWDQELIDK